MAKKKSNKFEGVVRTHTDEDGNELPLRSAAAEVLVPIKEHRLNEQQSDCIECGHACHCENNCNKTIYTGAVTGDSSIAQLPSQSCQCTNCQCHKKAMAKDRVVNKKKKRLKSGTLRDLLDKKRFGKSAVV